MLELENQPIEPTNKPTEKQNTTAKQPLRECTNSCVDDDSDDCTDLVCATVKSCCSTVFHSMEIENEPVARPKQPISQLLQAKLANQLKMLEKTIKCERRVDPRLQRNKPIKEVINLDANILNYGQFQTGKVMGCTLIITNHNLVSESLTIEFDTSTCYVAKTLMDEFPKVNIGNLELIENSEEIYKCWLLENPDNKKLEKSINFRLEPKGSIEIMVILKSPTIKQTKHLYNMLIVRRQCDVYTPNGTGNVGLWANKFLRVCLHGIVEAPQLICTRRLVISNVSTIPLAVKKRIATQRYRIPFKNVGKIDTEVEFSFLKTDHALGIDYFCIPNYMKLQPNCTGILSVLIKNIHASEQPANSEDATYHSDGEIVKDPRMLVAKVKNSQIFFSFYIDAILY